MADRIVFAGRDITGLDSHEICNLGIGQVAEGRQLFPSLTTTENLAMGAMLPRARKKIETNDGERICALPASWRAQKTTRRHPFRR